MEGTIATMKEGHIVYYNTVARKLWQEKWSCHTLFCAATILFVLLLPNSTVLFVVWASFKLLAAGHSSEFSGKEERSWARLLRSQNIKDTRFMQNIFKLDKYRSCWFVHAVISPFLCILSHISQVENQNVLGTKLASLASLFFCPEHML